MDFTRITDENIEYFDHLIPGHIYSDDGTVKFGIVDEDEAAAVCAVSIMENMACIKWLYTDPYMRERGCATELMRSVEDLIRDMNLTGMIVDFTDDDGYMESFLEDQDFLVGTNEDIYVVPTVDAAYGVLMDQIMERHDRMPEVHSCDEGAYIHRFMDYASDLGFSAARIRSFSPRFSMVKINDDAQITGSILVRESGSDDLVIEYLNNDTGSTDVVGLVLALDKALIEADRTDGYLIFADHEGLSVSFIKQLTGNDPEKYAVKGSHTAIKLFS